ncbi:hypothetical protein C8R43DRAFT_960331 [Mycena crocata]|nr:hypothetical protein C8R43DRAFT_1180596 [Mycena crocata]KAJ7118560.1 hypothetical protein C8R43DRAFT_960331 [Mycena crocata]
MSAQLPPEIMALIFEFCLPYDPQSPIRFASKDTAPLLLARVSQYWRDIALNTPVLWSCIRLSLDFSETRLPLLETWLARSGLYPVTLELVHFHRKDAVPTDALANILRRHAHQLKSLRLRLPYADVERIAQCPLPLLQHVDVRWIVGLEPLGHFKPLFWEAPLLQNLAIDSGTLATLMSPDALPWSRLKKITCANYTVSQCFRVLQLASSLEHATFVSQRPSINTSIPELIPQHVYLRSLSVAGWDAVVILRQVRLPGLKDLRFSVQAYQGSFMHAIIPELENSIQKLDLMFLPDDGAPLVEYLAALRSLTDLHLRSISRGALLVVFGALTGADFLPTLKTLHVECDEDRNLYPSLVNMLSARGQGSRRLGAATFEFNASIDTPDRHERSVIHGLKQQGMQLSFTAEYTYGKNGWMGIVRSGFDNGDV